MKLVNELNIKGIILDKVQLEKYLERLASNHNVIKGSSKNTFPIQYMKDNFEFISKTYNLLDEHIKLNIPISPAGEWLLDNFYIIEETAKIVSKELTLKKYKNLIGIENGPYKGFARSYVLASEILAYTDNKIDGELLKELLSAYQNKKYLSMEEIWNISVFMQIAIIKSIKEICERIYASQMQKYKVENIIERLVEKNGDLQKFAMNKIKQGELDFDKIKYPFVEYMSYRLKKYGKISYPYLKVLEEEVQKTGSSVEDVIKKEHFEVANQKVMMENSIKSLKSIQRMDFLEIFERINGVEEILRDDPAKVYDSMDFKTKIYYRNAIKNISEKTKMSETYIAKKSLELAKTAALNKDGSYREKHIGFYLVGDGLEELCKKLELKTNLRKNRQKNAKMYIFSVFVVPIILSFLLAAGIFYGTMSIWKSIFSAIFSYALIMEIYIKTINYILGKTVKPDIIPKLELNNGIPEESATFVVVPTIVKTGEKVEEIMKKLEVYYIANKSENLYFALLRRCCCK